MPLLIVLAIAYFANKGCSDKENSVDSRSNYSSYHVDSSAAERECDISNPYSHGTGHYAGFEWGELNSVSSCGGNSHSFIEGCEKYLNQHNCNEH